MKKLKRLMAWVLAVAMLFTMSGIQVLATDNFESNIPEVTQESEELGQIIDEKSDEQVKEDDIEISENTANKNINDETEIDTTQAPADYQPKEFSDETSCSVEDSKRSSTSEKKILLIEDTLPWDCNTNSVLLNNLGYSYDKVSTKNFLSIDLTKYAVVIFANDQAFETYENYNDFREYLELFAELGGVIIFGACDLGWAEGNMTEQLPGGVKKISSGSYRNFISDNNHPIVTGELSQKGLLTNEDLYEKWCSHSAFDESSFPIGTKIILKGEDNLPTLIEYPVGHGRVIASGLSWEFNYYYGGLRHPDGGYRGTFAKDAMDDMFIYAVEVSAIGITDLSPLKNYYNNANQHIIGVADIDNYNPITDASVVVNNANHVTDKNGLAYVSNIDNGRYLVTVEKDGYKTMKFEYNFRNGKSKFFYLEKKTDSVPYFTMVEEIDKMLDLQTESCFYEKDSNKTCKIKVDVEWMGHEEGTYIITQIDSVTGVSRKAYSTKESTFTISPGELFEPENPIYISAVAKDGTKSEPVQLQINVYKKTPVVHEVENNLESNTLQIIKPGNGNILDELYTSIFPANYNVQSTLIPVHVEKETDEITGNRTFYAFIGVDSSQIADKNVLGTMKKTVKEGIESGDKINHLCDKMTAFGAAGGSYSITNDWEEKYEVGGYYVVTYDKNGDKILEDGGICFKSNNEKTFHGSQFMAGPVPIYIKLKGGSDVDLVLRVRHNDEWTFDGNIDIGPYIKLSGGLGVNGVVTVGAGGEGDLKLTIQPSSALEATLQAYLEAYMLLVFDWEFTLAQKSFRVYPSIEKNTLRSSDIEAVEELKILDMDFSEKTTEWNTRAGARIQDDLVMLQNSVLPSVVPVTTDRQNSEIAIFQYAVNGKEAQNSIRLMYSVYENGSWTIPKLLSKEDKTALYAEVMTVNGETYAVWQQCEKLFSQDEATVLMNDIMANTELYCAKFDENKQIFGEAIRLTNNSRFESQPKIVDMDGTVGIVWVESISDITLENSSNRVYVSKFINGIWTEPAMLGEIEQFITHIDAAWINNEIQIVYVAQDVKEEPEVYCLKSSKKIRVTNDDYIQENLQIFGELCIYESEDGLCFYNLKTGTTEIVTQLDDVSGNYKLTGSDEKPILYWTDGTAVYVSSYINKQWSPSAKILEKEGYSIKRVECISDGEHWLLFLTTSDSEGVTALQMAKGIFVAQADLNVLRAEEQERNKDAQPIVVKIENTGATLLDDVTCVLTLNGTELSKVEIEQDIGVQESLTIKKEFLVPDLTTPTTYQLSLYEDNILLDTKNVTFGNTDVGMEVHQRDFGNEIVLEILISNESSTPTDVAFTIKDTEAAGMTLFIEHMLELKNGESYLYLYTFEKEQMEFDAKGEKKYLLELETSIEDYDYTNNHKTITVCKNEFDFSDVKMPDLSDTTELTAVTGIDFNEKEVFLKKGETKQLKAQILPANASCQTVVYESDDYSIAYVDETGKLIANGEGNVVVKAISKDGNFVAELQVNVEKTLDENENLPENGGNDNSEDGENEENDTESENNNPETEFESDSSQKDDNLQNESETENNNPETNLESNNTQTGEDLQNDAESDMIVSTGDTANKMTYVAAIFLGSLVVIICIIRRKLNE